MPLRHPSVASGRELKPHVVVVAMKPQLKGRVRRNVETLLELGAQVTVISVRSGSDFFAGLDHPDLSAHLIDPVTRYWRLRGWEARAEQRRADMVRIRPQIRYRYLRQAWRLRARPGKLLRHLVPPPRYTVRHGYTTPYPGWLVTVAMVVLLPLAVVLGGAALVRRRVSRPVAASPAGHRPRGSRWTAVRVVRGVYRRSQQVSAALSRVADRCWLMRRGVVSAAKRALLVSNRVERFVLFWQETEALVREAAPDLVVSSDLPGLVGTNRAARRLGIGQVHDCHELYLESTTFTAWERAVLKPVEKRYMRLVSAVVAVNQSIADEYRGRYGVTPRVVRNCTDRPTNLRPADIRTLAGIGAGTDVILYQGGFSTGRGLDVCIEAMAHVARSAHLVLLGEGHLRQELAHLAQVRGVSERVHIVDAVEPENLLAYTSSATIGLIPYQPVSMNNYFSLPNKIFEYTSVGLPVVASDLPEIRKIAVDSACGVVYQPYDPRSLARALSIALEPSRLREMRSASVRYGEENSWKRERGVLVGAITECLPRFWGGELRLG